jgi:hypothetical protein
MVLSIQDAQVVSAGSTSGAYDPRRRDVIDCRNGHSVLCPLSRTGGWIDVAGLEDTFCVSVLRDVDHGLAEDFGGRDMT